MIAVRYIYHLPKPTPEGQIRLTLSPLELIGRLAALISAPRLHRHRYYGVLAPNARRRPAVTAMACEARASGEAGTPANAEEDNEPASRSPARYLWAMRLARLYAVFLLLCPACGAPLRIIAFITDTPAIRQILDHIGEPSTPPPPAALPDGAARRRPRRSRSGDSLRSILSPITTTTKAFPGDRRFLRAETVRIPAAPVAPAVRDASA
jgi:hypothetical protein